MAENDFDEMRVQDLIEADPKNREWFEKEKKIHKHEGNEYKEFMEYW